MNTEMKQYTEEEISKMTMKEWRAAGMPKLSFEFKYKMTEQEARAILATLVVGKIYEDTKHGGVYKYEGGERGYLLRRVASSGSTALLDWKGDLCNVAMLKALKESSVSVEEFDAYYKRTSQSMADWCDKNNKHD
jgi:hypothetical protein